MCPSNKHAMDWLVDIVKSIDPAITPTKLLFLDFEANMDIIELACTWITVETLSFTWAKRKSKKSFSINELLHVLKDKVQILEYTNSFPNVSRQILQMIQ